MSFMFLVLILRLCFGLFGGVMLIWLSFFLLRRVFLMVNSGLWNVSFVEIRFFLVCCCVFGVFCCVFCCSDVWSFIVEGMVLFEMVEEFDVVFECLFVGVLLVEEIVCEIFDLIEDEGVIEVFEVVWVD